MVHQVWDSLEVLNLDDLISNRHQVRTVGLIVDMISSSKIQVDCSQIFFQIFQFNFLRRFKISSSEEHNERYRLMVENTSQTNFAANS